ncbi:hypothetical protein Ahia01_000811300, partial [Argonauta hians]
KVVFYCSVTCLRNDWDKHCKVCRIGATASSTRDRDFHEQNVLNNNDDDYEDFLETVDDVNDGYDNIDHAFYPDFIFADHPFICQFCKGFKFMRFYCDICCRISYCSILCLMADWIHQILCLDHHRKTHCARCQRSDIELKKCSQCSNKWYCSKNCQRADWKNHKTFCQSHKPKAKDGANPNKKSPRAHCARCQKSDVELKKCTRCSKIWYCSKTCQRADWKNHKTSCQSDKPKDGTHPNKEAPGAHCAVCQKSDVELKKCTQCSKIWYCSKKCQRADWKNHKTSCQSDKPKDETNPNKEASGAHCARCQISDVELKKCTQCSKIWYCSKKCQRADWKNHKTSCQSDKPKDGTNPNKEAPGAHCAVCQKSDVELKKCTQCSKIWYCSKKCQRADWKNHKTSCQSDKPKDGTNTNKEASGAHCARCQRSDVELKKCAQCSKIWYCSKTCRRADWKNHKTSCQSDKPKDETNPNKEASGGN